MRLIFAAALLAPSIALAAGDSTTAPKKTETTKDCFSERQWDPDKKSYVRYSAKVNGVWDPKIKRCVRPDKASSLDLDTLYGAVRELAYAGQLDEAQTVLEQMPQDDDRVMTYWGFTHRKLGNIELANAFYQDAIDKNPDNILARSYMAQGFVDAGRLDDAVTQWQEILARGGAGTWAETSLKTAIQTGQTFNY